MEFFDSYNEQLSSDPPEKYLDGLREALNKADADAIRGATSAETLEELVQHCLDREKYTDALRFSDVLIEFVPYSGEAWMKRGIALHELGKDDEAMEAFNRALALSPADEELLAAISETYCDTDDYEKALEYAERALTLNPANEDALWNKAVALQRSGKNEDASQIFRAFLNSERYCVPALLELASCSDALDNFDEAVAFYERHINENPYNYTAWHNLGLLYNRRDMHQKAIDHFDMALAIKEDFPPAWLNRGNAFTAAEQFDEAVESYKNGLKHAPEDIPTLHNLGSAYLELEKFRDAIRYFSLALKFQPENVESLFGRGCCYDELGQSDKALADFNRALSFDGDDAAIWYAKADAEYNLGLIKSSLLSYHIALNIDPEDYECALDYAETLCETGAYQQALILFEKCCAQNEQWEHWADAHYGRAKALIGMERRQEAFFALELAFSSNPKLKLEFEADFPALYTQRIFRRLIEN